MVQGALRCLDAARRREHAHLLAADDCRYLFEYHPGRYRAGGSPGGASAGAGGSDSASDSAGSGGGSSGAIRRLIGNFKCPPTVAAASAVRLHYKECAIEQIAAALRAGARRAFVEAATWVPIPPSAASGAPDYDDRLARTLQRAFAGYDLDVRRLLRQTRSTAPDHRGTRRLPIPALLGLIHLEERELAARPLRSRIVLFDDVLTTGKHYRCCERRLHESLPEVPVCGCFIARRALPSSAGGAADVPVCYAK
ncbi:MAG TPA: hypothetical protein VMD56_02035 [Steroidobacteraceae bacterium]|nr:hypothetical protein [Steroidobacteraceae bacterium]